MKKKLSRMTWLSICLICVWCGIAFAQSNPIKWGKVPMEDLKMTVYPPDSNAAAVILCDFGDVYFGRDLTLVYERHTRIKILTEAGYDLGTVERSYYAKDNIQNFKSLKGQTFNLNAEGKIVKTKLDKKSIFETKSGGRKTVKFTLPALQPGSVIEYRYKIESSRAAYFPDWTFQKSEPVRWSEFRSKTPQFYEFVSVFQGTEQIDTHEKEMISENYTWMVKRNGRIQPLSDSFFAMKERRVMQDVPALREEPFMTTPEDFRSKVRFQLSIYSPPYSHVVPILNTWAELVKDLLDDEDFGKQIGRHKVLRERARSLVAGVESDEEKLIAIYDDVRTTMKWNGGNRIFCRDKLDKVYKNKEGNVTEINLMLTSMLRDAGLAAYPVIISTRSHGKIQPLYPIYGQFNSIIVNVKLEDKEYLLDATSPLRPYNLLPVSALNHAGYLVDKDNHGWVKINSAGKYRRAIAVKATLKEDGSLEGQVQSSEVGYPALFHRRELDEQDHEEFLRDEFLGDFASAQVDSFTVDNHEQIEAPLTCTVHFSIPDYAQVAGDFIYLNPTIVERTDENPFKLRERTFPVDFAYRRDTVYTLQLTLPDNYLVQEQPRNQLVRIPNAGGEFRRTVQPQGNVLSLMSRTRIKKPTFEPNEYQGLREFYDHVVAAGAEQIVLKKSTN